MLARFFDDRGRLRPAEIARLHADIGTLLLPSPERAIDLDRAYQAIVREQSFVRGRDAVLAAGLSVAACDAAAGTAARQASAPAAARIVMRFTDP